MRILITEPEALLRTARLAHGLPARGGHLGRRSRRANAQATVTQCLAPCCGQHMGDTHQGIACSLGQRGFGTGRDPAQAQHQRVDLGRWQGHRRQGIARRQLVADAGFPAQVGTLLAQGLDIAVQRAQADAQRVGQRLPGHRPPMAAQQLQQLGQAQRTRHQPTSALDATTCSPGGGARAASTSALAIRSAGLIRHARGNTGPNTPSTRRAKRSPRRTCCRCPPIRPGRTRFPLHTVVEDRGARVGPRCRIQYEGARTLAACQLRKRERVVMVDAMEGLTAARLGHRAAQRADHRIHLRPVGRLRQGVELQQRGVQLRVGQGQRPPGRGDHGAAARVVQQHRQGQPADQAGRPQQHHAHHYLHCGILSPILAVQAVGGRADMLEPVPASPRICSMTDQPDHRPAPGTALGPPARVRAVVDDGLGDRVVLQGGGGVALQQLFAGADAPEPLLAAPVPIGRATGARCGS
ncbi:hypothetical protein G6F22_012852 [Rhizopus arrhizus]|nr:hypothetical protein G6F22_012852 [Rhizopus arrhizus]